MPRSRNMMVFCLALALGGAGLAAAAEVAPSPDTSPPNVALSNVSENSVQVAWEPIAGATRYELSYGTDEAASNRVRTFLSGTTYQLTRLLPNTIYRVKVRAVIGGRAGSWSPLQEFSTQIPSLTDLTADDIRDTSIHLIWTGKFSDLPDTYYEVSFGTDQDASSDGMRRTSKNFLTLSDLSPETTYYIKLRARNPNVTGPWNTPISVSTLPFSPALAPGALTAASDKPGGVMLAWRAVAGASNYDVSYGTDAVAENMGIVPVSENRFNFQLSPNTQYAFKVRAVVKGNSGPWSDIVSCLTLPATPRGLMVTMQTSDSALLSWKSLSGALIARYYHVRWGTDPSAGNLGVTVTANAELPMENLRPGQKYYARVRTMNATGASPWSDPVEFNTLPAGLLRLKVSQVKHDQAEIQWPETPQAAGYEVAYGTDEDAGNRPPFEVPRPPAKLKNLKDDQTYYVRVRALFQNSRPGPWSNLIQVKTFPVPPKPLGLSLSEAGGTYVRLTWTAAVSISTYEVFVSTDEFGEKGQLNRVNRAEAYVKSLRENTTYFAKVRALNLGGPGDWSEPLAFSTLPDVAPRGLAASQIKPTEAFLSWEGVPGTAAASYEIRFAPGEKPWNYIRDYPSRTLALEKIAPESNYRVQVRAHNPAGYGPWCEEMTFTTPPAPPATAPRDLAAKELTDISATVVWSPMPKVDGYLFSAGTDTDASNRGEEKLDGTHFDLKGLIPETNYFVKVKAYNQSGQGPWSDILMISTPPTPPISAPAELRVSEITPYSFRVTWEASEDALSYELALSTEYRGRETRKSASSPSFVFTDLQPETVYFLKVRKVNRGGSGPWSQGKQVTTAARKAP